MDQQYIFYFYWISKQLGFLFLNLLFCFFVFEIIPLFFGYKNTIKKNLNEFFKYQLLRGIYAFTLGAFVTVLIFKGGFNLGIFDITHLSILSQVIILYFCSEFLIYLAHMGAHKIKIPVLSNAHKFHHTVKEDLQWVNSRKEHLFSISLFVLVFCFFFFIFFKSSPTAHLICTHLFIFWLAFTHFKIPLILRPLGYIFLLPGDHVRHHTKRSGPYGVTLSLFDTIFNTFDEKNRY
jgi:hypothetical protein